MTPIAVATLSSISPSSNSLIAETPFSSDINTPTREAPTPSIGSHHRYLGKLGLVGLDFLEAMGVYVWCRRQLAHKRCQNRDLLEAHLIRPSVSPGGCISSVSWGEHLFAGARSEGGCVHGPKTADGYMPILAKLTLAGSAIPPYKWKASSQSSDRD